MIEGVSQFAGSGPNFHGDLCRDGGAELDVKTVFAAFGLELSLYGPVLFADESFYSLFETGDVFLRVLN